MLPHKSRLFKFRCGVVVFDREAAAHSTEVTRDRTGGINHPLISLALRSLRTPCEVSGFQSGVIGVGKCSKNSALKTVADDQHEPIVILTYLVAYNSGDQFFNHKLHVYAVSPRRGEWIDITSDGKLVEDLFWSQLDVDNHPRALPALAPTDLANIANLDRTFRLELEATLRAEGGNWLGAVWPIALSVLVQE